MEKSAVILGILLLLSAGIFSVSLLIGDENISITGFVTSGLVDLYVENGPTVFIINPENTTYNFDKGDPYLVPLNVSTNFVVESWKYSIYDVTHGVNQTDLPLDLVNPNGTITAYRWQNRLVVSAKEEDGNWYSSDVYFYVDIPNSAPIIDDTDGELFSCENERLSYFFNSTDIDEEVGYSEIHPNYNIFSVAPRAYPYVLANITRHQIFSGPFSKSNVGGVNAGSKTYERTIYVKDDSGDVSDSLSKNITLIEVNNPPVAQENLGTQTIWNVGDGRNFYEQWDISDTEDGSSSDDTLNFNISFGAIDNLFEINGLGVMNFTADETLDEGVYSVRVCVEDNALLNPHENISLCAPANYTAYSICDDFSLTVTSENRAPQILDYSDNELSVLGVTNIDFWVEVYDSDSSPYNVSPDVWWYVDDVLKEQVENESNATFTYQFPCEVRGSHNVTAFVTDGELNDSYTWELDVSLVACPVSEAGGGGGGGGGAGGISNYCVEEWTCGSWGDCRNAKRAVDSSTISPEEYVLYLGWCEENGNSDERFCGFQFTSCRDVNNCSNEEIKNPKPAQVRYCYFTENPSCSDGITNCHDGDCEVLMDCGGPCPACPTCTDGIQNGGEQGIDCGGPCPYLCEEEHPMSFGYLTTGVLCALLAGLVLFIGRRAIKIIKYKRELDKGSKREWRK